MSPAALCMDPDGGAAPPSTLAPATVLLLCGVATTSGSTQLGLSKSSRLQSAETPHASMALLFSRTSFASVSTLDNRITLNARAPGLIDHPAFELL